MVIYHLGEPPPRRGQCTASPVKREAFAWLGIPPDHKSFAGSQPKRVIKKGELLLIIVREGHDAKRNS